MTAHMASALALVLALACGMAQGQQTTQSAVPELKQRAPLGIGDFFFGLQPPLAAGVDNAAATVFQMDATANPLLATLPAPGVSVNRGEMQACAVLLPHVHPRATEVYYVLNGNFTAGLSEENGGRNIESQVATDQLFIVPQGLPHYMANLDCQPADYLQIFNNIDPGLITLTTALSKFQPFTLGASNSTATAAAYGAFGMDADCMARCGISSS